MYNFSVTAGLKTYIDLIARVGISFHYTAQGPEGLLKNKKAYIIVSTGGTPLGSVYDFVTPYLKTIFSFLGITDITFIPADLGLERKEVNIKNAIATIQQIETV
jgi:FMN-dependent NADH-azoreductase